MSDKLNIIENTVRASFAGVVWSHKIQEKQADIYDCRYKCFEIIQITTSAFTSVGIVTLLFYDEYLIKLISALVSFVTVVISMLLKSFNMQELCTAHKKSALTLLIIRDKYQHLLMEIHIGEKSYIELNNEYMELEQEKHKAYLDSPSTSDKAVELASQALKIKSDNKYTDNEINNFLPNILWKRGS
ncbi:MAG: SLATT domain-containing protein [Campylobacteraceae bacterium]|jgi:hypothetical protein|nr:SLATT domain-containing protein [Campylobacteraceae bacterium]